MKIAAYAQFGLDSSEEFREHMTGVTRKKFQCEWARNDGNGKKVIPAGSVTVQAGEMFDDFARNMFTVVVSQRVRVYRVPRILNRGFKFPKKNKPKYISRNRK